MVDLPSGKGGKYGRAGLNAISGAIPFVGGILSAAAGVWGEQEQGRINELLRQWLQMLEDELQEKGKTIAEVIARLDMHDGPTKERIESEAYQAILKKAFRNWAKIDSDSKREKIRNILANSAASRITSDDVVKLFIDWIALYSDFHFEVIGEIYRSNLVSRGIIWEKLGKERVREDSAEADLYKLLIRDLSTGGVIRQHRETDHAGNFVKSPGKHVSKGGGSRTMESAFGYDKPYCLTELGKQFVHYAMTELTARISYSETDDVGAT